MPKITKRLIDKTDYPQKGQVFLRDDELLGFALRLTTNTKAFILEKRINGRVRRMTIGPYGPLTLENARSRAKDLIGRISRGEDPAEDKVEKNREPTFGDLVDLYIQRHIPKKKSGYRDLEMIEGHLLKWRNRKLLSITRKEVAGLHAKTGKKAPYTANRLIALLRKMLNLGIKWGFYQGDNPARMIDLFPEEKRDRFIQGDELPQIIQSLKEEESIYVKAIFLVLLFTGTRKTEALTMKWEDLNLSSGTWRIPHTKTGKPHTLPLAAPVLALLQTLPRHMANPYVFPGRSGEGHLVNITKAWGRIRDRAGLPDVRIHDLRRTVGSWLAGSGTSLPIIGKVLNHTQPSTTAVYARLQLDPVRQVLEANAQKMIEIGNIEIEQSE